MHTLLTITVLSLALAAPALPTFAPRNPEPP